MTKRAIQSGQKQLPQGGMVQNQKTKHQANRGARAMVKDKLRGV